jgi:hypothetical protein
MKQSLEEQAKSLRSELAKIEEEQRYQQFPLLYDYLKQNGFNFFGNFADKIVNENFSIMIKFYAYTIEACFQDRKNKNYEIYPLIFAYEKNESANQELEAIENLKKLTLPIKYKMYFDHDVEFYYNSLNMEDAKESYQEVVNYMKANDFKITIHKVLSTD